MWVGSPFSQATVAFPLPWGLKVELGRRRAAPGHSLVDVMTRDESERHIRALQAWMAFVAATYAKFKHFVCADQGLFLRPVLSGDESEI